jgi:predicted GTPase
VIVLDEQLQGQDLDSKIDEWRRGAVTLICDLRPGTIIKDDVIPQLLRKKREPTFVTINTVDFWQKAPADRKYCIVCFAIRDTEVSSIPDLLRQLLNREGLRKKRERSGHVF